MGHSWEKRHCHIFCSVYIIDSLKSAKSVRKLHNFPYFPWFHWDRCDARPLRAVTNTTFGYYKHLFIFPLLCLWLFYVLLTKKYINTIQINDLKTVSQWFPNDFCCLVSISATDIQRMQHKLLRIIIITIIIIQTAYFPANKTWDICSIVYCSRLQTIKMKISKAAYWHLYNTLLRDFTAFI